MLLHIPLPWKTITFIRHHLSPSSWSDTHCYSSSRGMLVCSASDETIRIITHSSFSSLHRISWLMNHFHHSHMFSWHLNIPVTLICVSWHVMGTLLCVSDDRCFLTSYLIRSSLCKRCYQHNNCLCKLEVRQLPFHLIRLYFCWLCDVISVTSTNWKKSFKSS